MKSTTFLVIVAIALAGQGQAQQQSCYAERGCLGGVRDSATTAARCCLAEGGMSFEDGNRVCQECVVVEFSATSYIGSEDSQAVFVELQREFAEDTVTLTLVLTEGTAEGGDDFGLFPAETISLTAIMLPNETSLQFGIFITDDDIVETEEQFSVMLRLPSASVFPANPAGLVIGGRDSATVTIIDNDVVDVNVSIAGNTTTVASEGDSLELLIFLDGTTARDVSVTVSILPLTAQDGDFALVGDGVIVFSPIDTSQSVTVFIVDDLIVEGTEELLVVVEPSPGEIGVTVSVNASLIQISDVDQLEIEFELLEAQVSEADGTASIVLRKNGENEIPVTVEVFAVDGSAIVGSDYNFTNQTVVFESSDSIQTLEVRIFLDGIVEAEESFELQLAIPVGEAGVTIPPPNNGIRVTITDSDFVTVGFEAASLVVSESAGSVDVAVQLTEGTLATELPFEIVLSMLLAEENEDFTLPTGRTFVFGPAVTTVVVPVTINDDSTFEGREDFALEIRPSDPRMLTDPGRVVVVINDNEDLNVNFTEEVYEVLEGASSVNVTVELFSLLERPLDLQLTTINGRATAGSDYAFENQTLVFSPDVSQRSVQIVLFDDSVSEGIEEFFVQVAAEGVDQETLEVVAQATIEITDDERTEVALSQSEYTANEGDGFVRVFITKSGITVRDIFVTVLLSDDTARGGSDYGPFQAGFETIRLSGVIDANDTELLFGIPVLEDEIVEETESFFVSLMLSDDEVALGTDLLLSEATVFIEDNDAISVTLDPALSVAVDEGDAELTFSIQRNDSSPLDREVSVDVRIQPLTASIPEDFQASLSETLVFSTSSPSVFNVTVVVIDDLIAEGSESFLVFLTTPGGDGGGAVFIENQTLVEIVDNDVARVEFSMLLYEVDEVDGAVTVCLTKNIDTAAPFTAVLQPSQSAASPPVIFPARADLDFDSAPVDVTFQPNARESCADIVIFSGDATGEGLEEFSVSFTLPSLPALEAGSSNTATIRIQDIQEITIGFERQTSISVLEGEEVVLCVSVFNPLPTEPLSEEVVVDSAAVEGTADGSDYQLVSGEELVFTDSTRRQCVTFTITEDTSLEPTETFQVVLSEGGNGVSNVRVQPDAVTVEILDIAEDVVVGFTRPLETVIENEGVIEVCVEVSTPSVGEPLSSQVTLIANTEAGSAMASDFETITDLELVFNDSIRVVCIRVGIFGVEDGDKDFTIQLEIGASSANVVLELQEVTVTIIDIPTTATGTTPTGTTPTPPTEGPMLENATVVGDPLFSVPLNLQDGKDMLPAAVQDMTPFLCYEIHGQAGQYFNLVSDSCTSVNALYSQADAIDLEASYFRNTITRIGVQAVNSEGTCVNIDIDTQNLCIPMVSEGGATFTEAMTFNSAGVNIRKNRNVIRISVPNCGDIRLVMRVTCQQLTEEFPMIRLDITRGVSLTPTSHGLLGQFWNVPITIEEFFFTGPTDSYFADDSLDLFVVTVEPMDSPKRSFVSDLDRQKWDNSRDICLYSGNIQGGTLQEVEDPNDSVIEGTYVDYRTSELFSSSFMYSKFEQSCA